MTDKLSYDIISLIGLIDHIKKAANRYIWTKNRIVYTNLNHSESRNVPFPSDINAVVSDLGTVVAGGPSGLGTPIGLGKPTNSGNLVAMSQVQGGADVSGGEIDNSVVDPSL